MTLETVRAIAESGVDRISVGALTHSAVWLDLGLDWADARGREMEKVPAGPCPSYSNLVRVTSSSA